MKMESGQKNLRAVNACSFYETGLFSNHLGNDFQYSFENSIITNTVEAQNVTIGTGFMCTIDE